MIDLIFADFIREWNQKAVWPVTTMDINAFEKILTAKGFSQGFYEIL